MKKNLRLIIPITEGLFDKWHALRYRAISLSKAVGLANVRRKLNQTPFPGTNLSINMVRNKVDPHWIKRNVKNWAGYTGSSRNRQGAMKPIPKFMNAVGLGSVSGKDIRIKARQITQKHPHVFRTLFGAFHGAPDSQKASRMSTIREPQAQAKSIIPKSIHPYKPLKQPRDVT